METGWKEENREHSQAIKLLFLKILQSHIQSPIMKLHLIWEDLSKNEMWDGIEIKQKFTNWIKKKKMVNRKNDKLHSKEHDWQFLHFLRNSDSFWELNDKQQVLQLSATNNQTNVISSINMIKVRSFVSKMKVI